MLVQAAANPNLLYAAIGAGGALLGSIVGAIITLRIHTRTMREKRRDEIRSAYMEWIKAIDVRTYIDNKHIAIYTEARRILGDASLSPQSRAAGMHMIEQERVRTDAHRDESVTRESSAYACLMVADADTQEFKDLDRIRRIEPFKSANHLDTATGMFIPNEREFFEREHEQAVELGKLAVSLKKRFGNE